MGDVVQRHFPDVGFAAVGQCDHPLRVRLYDPHLAAREVGQQHPERNGHEQQRFVLFHYTQVEQDESQRIHDEERRVGNDVAESRHLV